MVFTSAHTIIFIQSHILILQSEWGPLPLMNVFVFQINFNFEFEFILICIYEYIDKISH